ncbi:hypothetical protein CJ178_01495 [Rhodococcus sp. ACPA4]|nr:hypothetical protein CJ178_01495 [Rhodococcus sp. ACPA4]PSR39741.1 hypothetical protein C7T36_18915 [Rhodococcus sp. AD45-ID]
MACIGRGRSDLVALGLALVILRSCQSVADMSVSACLTGASGDSSSVRAIVCAGDFIAGSQHNRRLGERHEG